VIFLSKDNLTRIVAQQEARRLLRRVKKPVEKGGIGLRCPFTSTADCRQAERMRSVRQEMQMNDPYGNP
jgi:hypothetical protein